MVCSLSALHVFPLKSAGGLSLDQAHVTPLGLDDDRRWMLVDVDGRFVTGRLHPELVRLRVLPSATGLELHFKNARAQVKRPDRPQRIAVTVWKDTVSAAHWPDADDALSDWLGQRVTLVHRDEQAVRPVAADYARLGDEVSFADGFPVLLLSSSAVDALNARLIQPVSALHFRPNLLIEGCAPHAEDDWKRIRIGEIEFDVVKPCTRCVFTTVDPQSGKRRSDGEPLQTLKEYRRSARGITFGQNLIPRRTGLIRVGDTVRVVK
ncbi:MAG: MOSC domain protein [Alphaproteobacteria bacterium ADurb.BinA280]|jgi:uncharacterized protein YcbX|nr:MOSC domain-containing protein [Xanthomonadales bacterium]OPZ13776.1 MAG: MOSC domain protein [Alphaproteobacteria bacterium ADurb.BinA280]